MPPLVLQTEDLHPQPAAWLADRCTLIHCPSDDPRFKSLLLKADALIVRTYTQVNQTLLDSAPNLKVIARAGVALDNFDLPACATRNITVVHAPAANTLAVVEWVAALILDITRPRTYLKSATANWHDLRKQSMSDRQLSDQTLGILGLGRIGSRIAHLMSTLNASTIYHDIKPIECPNRHNAQPVNLDTLLSRSDILTVHIDARPSNRNFLDSDAFSKLKSDVILINTSRGFILDTPALAAFLHNNPKAHAAIDVHDPEPITQDNPLLQLPNAHLTPHIAAGTQSAKKNMSWVVKDVWRVLQGEPPHNPAPTFES